MNAQFSYIHRSEHDALHPFAQVVHKLSRDKSISLGLRGLMMWALSHKDDFRITGPMMVKEFSNHMCKDSVYKLIHEGIEAGYIKHEVTIVKGLKKHRYLFSETARFKKVLRHTEFQDVEEIFEKPDFTEENDKFKKSLRHPEIQDTVEPDALEEYLKEKQNIITPDFQVPEPPKEKPIPAGGNNNSFYQCLSSLDALSPRQKSQFNRYPEEVVQQGVKYVTHPNTKLVGPNAQIKQLHAFCKDPEAYMDTLKSLDNPKPKTLKQQITAAFKSEQTYYGFQVYHDSDGILFSPIEGQGFYQFKWKDPDFKTKWESFCRKMLGK